MVLNQLALIKVSIYRKRLLSALSLNALLREPQTAPLLALLGITSTSADSPCQTSTLRYSWSTMFPGTIVM